MLSRYPFNQPTGPPPQFLDDSLARESRNFQQPRLKGWPWNLGAPVTMATFARKMGTVHGYFHVHVSLPVYLPGHTSQMPWQLHHNFWWNSLSGWLTQMTHDFFDLMFNQWLVKAGGWGYYPKESPIEGILTRNLRIPSNPPTFTTTETLVGMYV